MAYDDVHLDSRHASTSSFENDGYKSPTDALSILSVDTSSGNDDSVTKLTPMKNSDIGALIPCSPGSQDDVMSEDSMSIKRNLLTSRTKYPEPHHFYFKDFLINFLIFTV